MDDNDDFRESVSRFLTRRGYQVLVAANALDALIVLNETRVDLVIIDVIMPEANGLELLDWVREEHPNLPSVLYAGCAIDEDLLQEARERGAHGLLSKDMPLSQLLMEIHRLLDYQETATPSAALVVAE